MRVRRGPEADFERLREIAIEAKAHWGYERARVEEWALAGDFEPESLRSRLLYVAEAGGRPVGWAALIPGGEVAWLEDLWVDPEWIGKGLGRQLFERAADEARLGGARRPGREGEASGSACYRGL